MKTVQNKNQEDLSVSYSLDQLTKIGNGDKRFITEMLNEFTKIVSECSDIMRLSILNKDWAKLRSIAHKTIPSYSILELNDLVELLKAIERDAQKDEEHKNMKQLVNMVCEMNELVLVAIREEIRMISD